MNEIISFFLDLTVEKNNIRMLAVIDNQVIHLMHIQYVILRFLYHLVQGQKKKKKECKELPKNPVLFFQKETGV